MSRAQNVYTQTWDSRHKLAQKARDAAAVRIDTIEPKAFAGKEFNQLVAKYRNDTQPTNILAIGPFGSIYRRLIAPGLYKLNEAFEQATNGKKLNLNWLFADIHKSGSSEAQTNTTRLSQVANSSEEAGDGRLGYKGAAQTSYIPASDLMKVLRSAKSNAAGKKEIEYNGKKYPIDVAFVTSLVDTHLKYADALSTAGITAVTEKPMVAPVVQKQVDRMGSIVTEANKSFAADFFPYVDSMRLLEERPELLTGLGKLVAIHGTCTEPGNIEPGRGWLLDQERSGGGLFVADTAPHPLAWADYALNWYIKIATRTKETIDTSKASINKVDIYRLHNEDLKEVIPETELQSLLAKYPNIETHGTLNAQLKMPDHLYDHVAENLKINIAAGKGAGGRPGAADTATGRQKNDKPSLGLELVFEGGRIELSTGYTVGDRNIYDPYVARVPHQPTEENPIHIITAQKAKLGYNNMLVDWLLAAKGIFTDRLKAVSSAAKHSMKILHNTHKHIVDNKLEPQIYRLGEVLKPDKARIAKGWVNPLVAAEDYDFVGTKNF